MINRVLTLIEENSKEDVHIRSINNSDRAKIFLISMSGKC